VSGTGGVKGGLPTAATSREAAAVKYRLLTAIPASLAGGGNSSSNAVPSTAQGGHPGALLLCYRPKQQGPNKQPGAPPQHAAQISKKGEVSGRTRIGKPQASATSAPEQEPAPEHTGYVALLEDGLNNMGWSDLTHPSMAVASWRALAARWIRTASSTSTTDVSGFSASYAPWTALMSRWRDDSSTAVQGAAPLAALGVLQALESHEGAASGVVPELMNKLEHQIATARYGAG
jgi:hypothetical protein